MPSRSKRCSPHSRIQDYSGAAFQYACSGFLRTGTINHGKRVAFQKVFSHRSMCAPCPVKRNAAFLRFSSRTEPELPHCSVDRPGNIFSPSRIFRRRFADKGEAMRKVRTSGVRRITISAKLASLLASRCASYLSARVCNAAESFADRVKSMGGRSLLPSAR